MGAYGGFRYWLVLRGLPFVLVYVALFVANGLLLDWRVAYDVNVGITSPADTSIPALAWPLSVFGWLAVPGIAGAVAGYIVSSFIAGRRSASFDRLFADDDDE